MWPNLTKESNVTYPKLKLKKMKKDGSNKYDFFCPDVIEGGKFTKNYAGWTRSDIALINEQSTMQAAQHLLNQLPQFSDGENTSQLTDADIQLSFRSKYAQTSSEMIRWFDEQLKIAQNKREAQSQSKPEQVQFDNSDAEIVDNA